MDAKSDSLTERQRECLRLVTQGKKNEEIAFALGIAVSTTREHIEKAVRTLGAHNRRQAAAMLAEIEKEGSKGGYPPFSPVGEFGPFNSLPVATETVLRDGEGIAQIFSLPPPVIRENPSRSELNDLIGILIIIVSAAALVVMIANYPAVIRLAEQAASSIYTSVHHQPVRPRRTGKENSYVHDQTSQYRFDTAHDHHRTV